MIRDEVIWAAGFFDGEGCVSRARTPSGRIYPRLSVAQKDKRPLDRFECAFGVGVVRGPYQGKYWVYRTRRTEELSVVVRAMAPHLSEPKLEQVLRVLNDCVASYLAHPAMGVLNIGGVGIRGRNKLRRTTPKGEMRIQALHRFMHTLTDLEPDLVQLNADLAAL